MIPLRIAREYIHQLEHTGQREQLRRALATIPLFLSLFRGETRYDVLRHWSEIDHEAVETAYQEGLDKWRGEAARTPRQESEVLELYGAMYALLSHWRAAERVGQERLTLLRVLKDRVGESLTLAWLGQLAANLGRVDEAEGLVQQGETIARQIGDRTAASNAVGNRGNIHLDRGEYDEALTCFLEWEKISRQLGDIGSVSAAVGNQGIVHFNRGEYDEALTCCQQAGEEHREIGYRNGLSYWLAGTARTLLKLVESGGELPEYLTRHLPGITTETWPAASLQHARACAEECLAISRELSKPDTLTGSQELLARIEELIASAGGDDV